MSSLATRHAHTTRWSILSDLSVAEVSNISVISLALTLDQVFNRTHYSSVQVQLECEAMRISMHPINSVKCGFESLNEKARAEGTTSGLVNVNDASQSQISNHINDTTSDIKVEDDASSYAGTLLRCFPYGQDTLRRARLLGLVLKMSEVFRIATISLECYLL